MAVVLSQPDIRKAVEAGQIVFSPALEEDQWGQASIDLRLGFSFTVLQKRPGVKVSLADGQQTLGPGDFWKTLDLNPKDALDKVETYTISPGEFVLAMTCEQVTVPRDMIARIEGRSTYARAGLSMHQTAPWIQPGWDGRITLEFPPAREHGLRSAGNRHISRTDPSSQAEPREVISRPPGNAGVPPALRAEKIRIVGGKT